MSIKMWMEDGVYVLVLLYQMLSNYKLWTGGGMLESADVSG